MAHHHQVNSFKCPPVVFLVSPCKHTVRRHDDASNMECRCGSLAQERNVSICKVEEQACWRAMCWKRVGRFGSPKWDRDPRVRKWTSYQAACRSWAGVARWTLHRKCPRSLGSSIGQDQEMALATLEQGGNPEAKNGEVFTTVDSAVPDGTRGRTEAPGRKASANGRNRSGRPLLE